GVKGGLLYREINLAITPDTIAGRFTDDTLIEPMTKIGAGASSEVFSARYDTSDGSYRAAFKPLDPMTTIGFGRRTGIDPNNPQIAMRKLATYGVAKLLKFDVIVPMEIGVRKLPPPESGEQLGIVMKRASGVPGYRVGNGLFHQPSLQCELTKLQL